ncbi:uncharacterized protein LOC130675966 isoform X2 [Microplitis mediator]|uniref:uncharacterized protein LOC130675966 isoform X2 n=1 Tax=Microplitis mediator TaxID=375433 RepID=UPI0025544474|nr:uncharacterized protein LOC130675966 isoform X2 [Microplitis mediator]
MTACCRYSDLKSSVYNQKGEGYFEQLSAYNHMSAHLRRVLLAKSRVDSKNNNYLSKKRSMSAGRVRTDKTPSQEFIDRVAYDTEHHPLDVLRMGLNITDYNRSQVIDFPKTRLNSTRRPIESERGRVCSRSRSRYTSGLSFHSARPGSFAKKNFKARDKHDGELDDENNDEEEEEIEVCYGGKCNEYSGNSSVRSSPRSAKSKGENDRVGSVYGSSFESPSEGSRSRRDSAASKDSASSRSNESSLMSTRKTRENPDCMFVSTSDETKYSKFLYDITQEIVQNGYYKDEELRKVFQKHIKRNSNTLDKNKMMYELYQLKLSLNIIDQEDEDEEETIEKFIKSKKYSSVSPLKPPTPPKILDENKVTDKLMNPEEQKETYSKSPHSGRNTVVLVDANPELLITERDVLATLMEMNIDPDQAHRACKRLLKRSKDLHALQMVHAGKKDTGISPTASATRPEGSRSQVAHSHHYHQQQHQYQHHQQLQRQYDITYTGTSKKDFNRSKIQLLTCPDYALKAHPSMTHPPQYSSVKNTFYTVQNDCIQKKTVECICNSRLRAKSPCEILSGYSAKKKQAEKIVTENKLNRSKCYCGKKKLKDSKNKIECDRKKSEDKIKVENNEIDDEMSGESELRESESIELNEVSEKLELFAGESVNKKKSEESGTEDSSASQVTRLSFPAVRDTEERDVTPRLSLGIKISHTEEMKSSVTADESTSRELQSRISNTDLSILSDKDDTDESIAEFYSDDDSSVKSEVKDDEKEVDDDINLDSKFFHDDSDHEFLLHKEAPGPESPKGSRKRQLYPSDSEHQPKRIHTQEKNITATIIPNFQPNCAAVCPNLPQKKLRDMLLCNSCEQSVKKMYY